VTIAPAAGSEFRSLTPRKPRADAERNRDKLLQAAKAAFAASGTDISLEDIARRAGLGTGTFYRHFPTREAIIAAVYHREVRHLAEAATRLLATMAPGAALHEWMRLFVDYIATKKLIAPALAGMQGGNSALAASAGAQIAPALAALVAGGIAAGEIRADAEPADLLRALIGFTYGNNAPEWQRSAYRLIGILMAGLRVPPG
jgi:AcrR family transcriptional regulator